MTTRTRSRKATTLFALLAALSLVAAACGGESDTDGVATEPATLDQTAWNLTELGGAEPVAGPPANILFGATDETGAGESFGSTGCNSFSGSYETDGNTINIGPLITTLAGCNNPTMQPQEGKYLITLETAETFAISGDMLELSSGGEVTARFEVAEPDITLTAWVAISVNNGQGGVQSVIPGSEITAVFDGIGLLSGFGGCNNYSSAYRVGEEYDVAEGGEIVFAGIAAASKDCDADLQTQEDAFFTGMENTRRYVIRGLNLELRAADGATQVLFTRSLDG